MIESGAFCGCEGIKHLTISKNLTRIPEAAFNSLINLRELNIPDGVVQIYSNAFSGCLMIRDIVIPDSVEKIGDEAFMGCINVRNIEIPVSLTDAGDEFLNKKTNTYRGDYMSSYSKYNAMLHNKYGDWKINIYYTGTSDDWQKVSAFKELTDKYEKINNNEYVVHYNCTRGANFTRSSETDEDPFENLEDQKNPNDKKDQNNSSQNETTKPNKKDNTSKTEQSKTEQKNKAQTTTEQPAKTQSKSVRIDGTGTISADGKILTDTDGKKYLVAEKLTAAKLKKNTSIADKKSSGKYKITKLIKKNGKITGGNVTYMKPYNKKCKTANIKATVVFGGVTFKVTQVEPKAFKGCKQITKLSIGKNIKTIGKNAFSGCIKLKSVNCKSKVLSKIGANAFSGDKSLKKITFRTTKLKKKGVGKNAFKGTAKKLTIKVPKKVKNLTRSS